MDFERFNLIIARYLRGIATAEEEKELLHSIRESKEMDAAFRKQIKEWNPLKEIGNDPEMERKWNRIISTITPTEEIVIPKRKWNIRLSWVAVILLLLVSGITIFLLREREGDVEYVTVLADGEDHTIVLPDGTSIYLREGSTLIYPKVFDTDTRITEIKGEAFFDVKHQADYPFVVKVAELSVRVLGTSFSIHAQEETLSVILVNGKVCLMDADQKEVTQLLPDQRIDYSLRDGHYTISDVDGERLTSWHRGVISYDNASVEEIVRLIEETYHVSLSYAPTGMDNQRFSGAFLKTQELETVLEQTNKLTGMNLTPAQ